MPYPTLTQELFQQLGYVSDTPVINYFDAGVNAGMHGVGLGR